MNYWRIKLAQKLVASNNKKLRKRYDTNELFDYYVISYDDRLEYFEYAAVVYDQAEDVLESLDELVDGLKTRQSVGDDE